MKKMEEFGTSEGRTTKQVKIVDCGEVSSGKNETAARPEKGEISHILMMSSNWPLIF